MSVDATNSSGREMDCGRVMREEVLEGYLAGRLSDEDRDAFEQHYFECSRCFRDLQVLRAAQGELQRAGSGLRAGTRRPVLAWASAAALAAVVVLAVSVVMWSRPAEPPPQVGSAGTEPQSGPHTSESTAPSRGSEPTVAPAPSLSQLARVEPPRYEPLTLRGARDKATTRFQAGMEHYQKADYRDAVTELRAAASLEPGAPHICFFLGISYLLAGQNRGAVEWLNATIALGDSAYLEEAHFYLAKAYLRQEDPGAAATHLKRVVQLRESRSGEARQLLTQLERLRNRSN
jgi:tetratricopeptide (TPR) repeat protein